MLTLTLRHTSKVSTMTSHPRGPLGKGQKDARGRVPENEKIENSPIVLKIATGTKFNTRNPKIIIPNAKNQPFPLGEGQKMLGDENLKLVQLT